MAKSSLSRRSLIERAAVVGGGVLQPGSVTEPAALAQEAVSEAALLAAMTAEEILTPLRPMPASPDNL